MIYSKTPLLVYYPRLYNIHLPPLQLALDQVVDHLATGDASGVPESREVEGA
jgi:hypothetical protein